ncbi:competence protein ComK [Atopococcus tabaci]|uniref:competence protein ComK n=1 Tax=Atopococcus tabaci TaxID=269774 RepID=UPI000411B2F1|nr:competence protein ComK [Atopococcus tabaci]
MNHPLDEQEKIRYFRRSQDILFKRSVGHTDYAERWSKEKQRPSTARPFHLIPSKLTGQSLQDLVDMSFEQQELFPDEETYYVMDLSQNDDTPYNSLMFQLNESPMKSMETTTTVMDRYFASLGSPYDLSLSLGAMLGFKQCTPHVIGEQIFLPDSGTSKKPASWYTLHHVSKKVFCTKEKEVRLYANKYPLLTLEITKASFLKQLDRAANMYYIQWAWAEKQKQDFGFISGPKSHENIVHKYLRDNPYPLPSFTYIDYLHFFISYYTLQVLIKILGEGNPYLEEIRNHIKLPPYLA